MTQYEPSMIVADAAHQELAGGFPLGKRFKSAEVTRVGDGNAVHLGHHARADGRWRVYAFADADAAKLASWADAVTPVFARYTPADGDPDAVFDVKAVYQQRFDEFEITDAPSLFLPQVGPYKLTDWEKVYAAAPSAWCRTDIFDERELSRDGVVVVVRPDQYVAAILPLDGTEELSRFFAGNLMPAS
jgi:phenol 2-monooxygenase